MFDFAATPSHPDLLYLLRKAFGKILVIDCNAASMARFGQAMAEKCLNSGELSTQELITLIDSVLFSTTVRVISISSWFGIQDCN